jgi:hypothetical protein
LIDYPVPHTTCAGRDDEFLGRATVQTSVVAERGHIEGLWVDLEECESGKAKVSLEWTGGWLGLLRNLV